MLPLVSQSFDQETTHTRARARAQSHTESHFLRRSRYRERIRRTAKPAGPIAVRTAEAPSTIESDAAAGARGGGVLFDLSGHRPPRMLAFENITRRVQRTMEQQRLLRGQAMSREQADASSESSAAPTPVKRSRVPAPRSVTAVRHVDKDPTVLGRLPVRFDGGRQSDLAVRGGPSDSGTRARAGRKAGPRQAAGRGGDYNGDEALPSISPLRYKKVMAGATHKQQLELPTI